MNKLVDYMIETILNLVKEFTSNKKPIHDILRSMGALVYQNGSNLNIYNLNRLYGINESFSKVDFNEKTDGLLYTVLKLTESEPNQMDVEFIDNLNLISTQLIFNLTMPSQNELNVYIDDRYKVKSVCLLIKILRSLKNNQSMSHTAAAVSNSFTTDTSRHFGSNDSKLNGDEHKIMLCKILTKSLQSLENLFLSIQNLPEQQTNWLLTHFLNFQLGDILAIAKVNFLELIRVVITLKIKYFFY